MLQQSKIRRNIQIVDTAVLINQSLQALTFSPSVGNMPPREESELEGFFAFQPRNLSGLTTAGVTGKLYCGTGVAIQQRVAKLVPLHRTTGEQAWLRKQT